jgi:hypothetical protein
VYQMTSSSNFSESSDSESENRRKRTAKRVLEFQCDWLESFHKDNEYDLDYAQYEECVKHAAQFLNAFGAFEDSQASSTPSQSSSEQEQSGWPTLVLSDRITRYIDTVPNKLLPSIN